MIKDLEANIYEEWQKKLFVFHRTEKTRRNIIGVPLIKHGHMVEEAAAVFY